MRGDQLTAFGRDLAAALQGADLYGWELRQTQEASDQLYLIGDAVESLRQVETLKVQVRIYVRQEGEGGPVLGESSWVAQPGDDLETALAQAQERARLVSNPVFTLPGPEQVYGAGPEVDKGLWEEPQQALWQGRTSLVRAVAEQTGVRLAGAEIYNDRREIAFLNSTGLQGHYEETELSVQFALLARQGNEEAESLGWRQVRFYRHLDLEEMVRRYGRYALDGLQAELPPSGVYPVVFGEEALDTLFSYFAVQASGEAAFQGWAAVRPGEPVVSQPQGDRLTLKSDPTLPGGMASKPFDEHGLALRPQVFIQDNILQQVLADARYGSYLNLPATGALTNLVVAPGRTPLAELLQGDDVYHLLRFSTLEPNPVTGAISGEIRTGYRYRQGKVYPLKGGSVTGRLQEAFQRATLSREAVQRGKYQGPAGVRLEAMALAGY